MSRSTSSSDDDIGRFESVALSADMLQQQAERSKEIAQRRQARARQRRAGGGGILGVVAAGGSDNEQADEAGLLDAAQLTVAQALQQRLQEELEVEEVRAVAPAPAPPLAADEGASPAAVEQVRLFRRVRAGAPVRDAAPEAAAGGGAAFRGEAGREGAADWRGKWCLRPATTARCQAAAVDAAALEEAAREAAQQAAANIASPSGWLPADGDPALWSHRRKRRAAKLAAEAASWRAQRAKS